MLKSAAGKISRVVRFAVLIFLSAQILIGCLWGFLNCTRLQAFPDTAELVRLSGTLRLSNETGILYPALLIVIRTLTVNGPVKFYWVMYLIQIVLALVAWFVFARNIFKFDSKYKDAFFALAIVTNPFAMQVHLAVLEYSFVSSFVCLLIAYQIRFMREWKSAEKKSGLEKALRDISVTSLFWLAASLSRKEFIVIGCIPVIFLTFTIVKRLLGSNAKKALSIISPVILVLAFAGIICMTDSLFRNEERLSVTDSIKRDLYYRVAWSENFSIPYRWPDYLTSFVDDGMMTHFMNDPGLIREEFTDYVTEKLGSEETTEKFFEWAKISFAGNKKQIVKETISDMAGYVFAPGKTEYILRGAEFPGFAAGNYDVMKQQNPKLTKLYLRGSSVGYAAMIAACIIAMILEKLSGESEKKDSAGKRSSLSISSPVLLIVLCTAVKYTFLGCNVYDHRKAVFATCMWIVMLSVYALKVFDTKPVTEDK